MQNNPMWQTSSGEEAFKRAPFAKRSMLQCRKKMLNCGGDMLSWGRNRKTKRGSKERTKGSVAICEQEDRDSFQKSILLMLIFGSTLSCIVTEHIFYLLQLVVSHDHTIGELLATDQVPKKAIAALPRYL